MHANTFCCLGAVATSRAGAAVELLSALERCEWGLPGSLLVNSRDAIGCGNDEIGLVGEVMDNMKRIVEPPHQREADGATVDQLRRDIDRERTGEKVDGSDPAAAPLGTDEEAAGTPITPAQAALARRNEVRWSGQPRQDAGRPGAAWILIGFIVLIVLAIAGWGVSLI